MTLGQLPPSLPICHWEDRWRPLHQFVLVPPLSKIDRQVCSLLVRVIYLICHIERKRVSRSLMSVLFLFIIIITVIIIINHSWCTPVRIWCQCIRMEKSGILVRCLSHTDTKFKVFILLTPNLYNKRVSVRRSFTNSILSVCRVFLVLLEDPTFRSFVRFQYDTQLFLSSDYREPSRTT